MAENNDDVGHFVLLDMFWGLFMPGKALEYGDLIWKIKTVYELPEELCNQAIEWYSGLPDKYVDEVRYKKLAPLFKKTSAMESGFLFNDQKPG